MREFPRNWQFVELREVADVIRGVTYRKELSGNEGSPGKLPLLRATNIQQGIIWSKLVWIPEDLVKAEQVLRSGDIIVTTSSGSRNIVGKAALFDDAREATFGAFCSVVRSRRGIEPGFLNCWMQTSSYRHTVSELSAGVNIHNLRSDHLLNLKIPLPPVAEQRRIVAEIEKQFTRLEEAALLCAQLLRRTQALRTRLLKDMATGHPSRRLDTLLSKPLANGRSVRTAEAGKPFFKVLRLTAVRDGHIDLSQSKHGAWSELAARPFTVREGDFLIVRGNGSRKLVGRAGVVGKVTTAVAYPDTLIRARLDEELVHLPFLTAIWDSGAVREQIEKTARTTAGIYKINQKDLGELLIPMPDFEAQRALFATWSFNDSTLSQLELCANHTSSRIARLCQAILAKAFSGQLVPQDPSDEPASVLLDSIRAERGRAGRAPAKSRRSRSRMPEPALQSR